MTKTQNAAILNNIADALKLQRYSDEIPNKISPFISTTIDAKPIRNNVVKYTTAATSLWTTPTDKDFYLTGSSVTCSNVAIAEALKTAYISFVNEYGETCIVSQIKIYTQAAQSVYQNSDISFYPIKVKRGTQIILGGDTSAVSGNIFGFTEEVQG